MAVPPSLCLFHNGVGKIIDAKGKTCDMAYFTTKHLVFWRIWDYLASLLGRKKAQKADFALVALR